MVSFARISTVKVFAELFPKSSRFPKAEPWSSPAGDEIILGVSLLPSLFSLRPLRQREKRTNHFLRSKWLRRQRAAANSRCFCFFIWENPTCGFPPRAGARSPFRALSDDKGISPVATGDQGYAPWMGASFLKKA
jgi:hypothetical protein